MDKFHEWFKKKDKKTVTNLLAVFAVGLVLLVASGSLFGGNADKSTSDSAPDNVGSVFAQSGKAAENIAPTEISYETELEKRMEDILSLVDGAGSVKVMVTLAQEKEIVVASDFVYNTSLTKESDSDGGIREVSDIKREEKNILISDSEGNKPLVLTENVPKIEGIIIIAQGGDNILVKDALTRAAQVVSGVDINKVQVLKMK